MQSEPAAASCLPIKNEFVKFFRAANADTCIEHLYYFQECSLSAATVRHTQFYNPPHRTLSGWGKPNVHRQQKSLLVHPLYSLLHLHESIGQWISDKWHSRHGCSIRFQARIQFVSATLVFGQRGKEAVTCQTVSSPRLLCRPSPTRRSRPPVRRPPCSELADGSEILGAALKIFAALPPNLMKA